MQQYARSKRTDPARLSFAHRFGFLPTVTVTGGLLLWLLTAGAHAQLSSDAPQNLDLGQNSEPLDDGAMPLQLTAPDQASQPAEDTLSNQPPPTNRPRQLFELLPIPERLLSQPEQLLSQDDADQAEPTIRIEQLRAPGLGQLGFRDRSHPVVQSPWSGDAEFWLADLIDGLARPIIDVELGMLVQSILEAPGPEGSGKAILHARAKALIAMGRPQSAYQLISTQPDLEHDAAARRIALDAAVLVEPLDEFCANETRRERLPADFQLLCLWHEGDRARLNLNRRLAEERGVDLPAALLAVVDATVKDDDQPIPAPSYVAEPLARAVLREAHVRIADEIINPAIALALADNATLDPIQRLDMAENAAAAGLLDAASLQERYLGFEPDNADNPSVGGEPADDQQQTQAPPLENLDETASAATPPATPPARIEPVVIRAIAVQAVARETIPLARMALITEFWGSATADELPAALKPSLARIFADDAIGLAPTSELAPKSRIMADLMFWAGQFDLGKRWLALVPATPESRYLGVLSGMLETLPPAWDMGPNLATAALLADALGHPIETEWLLATKDLTPDANHLDVAYWRLADRAVQSADTRLGVLTLSHLVGGHPGRATGLPLWRLLRGLDELGQTEIARSIAIRHWLQINPAAPPANSDQRYRQQARWQR